MNDLNHSEPFVYHRPPTLIDHSPYIYINVNISRTGCFWPTMVDPKVFLELYMYIILRDRTTYLQVETIVCFVIS